MDEWRRVHEAVRLADIRERNKVRIRTQISKKDVLVRDYYPVHNKEERKIFKYYCPICLRYFNTILVASCCDNYICRFCIGDLAKRAKNDDKFRIFCSHCCAEEYKLIDVDLEAPLRVYTDTPFKLGASSMQEGSNTGPITPVNEFNSGVIDVRTPNAAPTLGKNGVVGRDYFYTPDGKLNV